MSGRTVTSTKNEALPSHFWKDDFRKYPLKTLSDVLYFFVAQTDATENDMAASPKDVLKAIMSNPLDTDNVAAHVASDATYVSLNYSNPPLKRVMPWAGTSHGPEGIVQTFLDVARYWNERELEQIALFGDDRYAALFGRMKYRSTVLGKEVISPFCVFIEAADGVCTHMQFMEDTFATTDSFRSGGEWLIRSDPDGDQISV